MMVSNSTNFNKTNNYHSSHILEIHVMDRHNNMAGLNGLMWSLPSICIVVPSPRQSNKYVACASELAETLENRFFFKSKL